MRTRSEMSGFSGPLAALLFSALLLLTGSCTDGRSPVQTPGDEPNVQLALSPSFSPGLTTQGSAEIANIRVIARSVTTGEEVGRTDYTVSDANASSWNVDIEIDLPAGINPQIEVTIELLNAQGSVEWSGKVGPITVTPGTGNTVTNVEIIRGPLDNLAVTSVNVSGAPALLRVGGSVQLSATATGQSGSVLPEAQIYWSSLTEEVATVTTDGAVHALAPGTARIVAAAGSAQVTTEIEVRAVAAGIMVTPTEKTVESLEENVTFSAFVLDEDGNTIQGETVTWASANPSILASQGSGVFRSKAEGSTTITATSVAYPSLSATADVTVKQVAASVQVTPSGYTFTYLGEEEQYSATAYDANGQAMTSALFLWSTSNGNVVSVDENGLATAEGNGTVLIGAEAATAQTASGGAQGGPVGTGVTGSTSATVEQAIHDVVVSPTQAAINGLGNTQQFYAAAKDAGGSEVVGTSFGWSSSQESVATIDGNGLATSVAAGTTTITAEAQENGSGTGISGTATLTVTETILNVSVDPTEATLYKVDETVQLTATTVDQNQDPVANVNYAWSSSNEDVAKVDQNGLVKAVGEGEAVITVTGSLASGLTGQDGVTTAFDGTATATITVELMTPAAFLPLEVGNSWTYLVTYDYGYGSPQGGGPLLTTETVMDEITGTVSRLGHTWYQICGYGVLAYLLSDGTGCGLHRATALAAIAMGLDGSWGPYDYIRTPLTEGTTWSYTHSDGWMDAWRIMGILGSLSVQGSVFANVLWVRLIQTYSGYEDTRLDVYFALGVGVILAELAWSDGPNLWHVFQRAEMISNNLGRVPTPSPALDAATGGATGFQPPPEARPYHFFGVKPKPIVRR